MYYFHWTRQIETADVQSRNDGHQIGPTPPCLSSSLFPSPLLQADWCWGTLLVVLHVVQCSQLDHCGGGGIDSQPTNRYTHLAPRPTYHLNNDLVATATIWICITRGILRITTTMTGWIRKSHIPCLVSGVGTAGHVTSTQIYKLLFDSLHLKRSGPVYFKATNSHIRILSDSEKDTNTGQFSACVLGEQLSLKWTGRPVWIPHLFNTFMLEYWRELGGLSCC